MGNQDILAGQELFCEVCGCEIMDIDSGFMVELEGSDPVLMCQECKELEQLSAGQDCIDIDIDTL